MQAKPELLFKYPLRVWFITRHGSEMKKAIAEFHRLYPQVPERTVYDHMRITMGERHEIKEPTLLSYAQFLNLPIEELKKDYHKFLTSKNTRQ